MRVKEIADALTLFINRKYPELNGFFIAKDSVEPTKINAYKAYNVEVYWHLPGKNHLVFKQHLVDKCLTGQEESLKERFNTVLLEQLFSNLNNIENEVIQIGRV